MNPMIQAQFRTSIEAASERVKFRYHDAVEAMEERLVTVARLPEATAAKQMAISEAFCTDILKDMLMSNGKKNGTEEMAVSADYFVHNLMIVMWRFLRSTYYHRRVPFPQKYANLLLVS